MKKRGDATIWAGEEIGKILIAVLCVAGLAILFFNLYGSFTLGSQKNLASASLKGLMELTNSGGSEFQVYNPSGWLITSFPTAIPANAQVSLMPRQCSNAGWETCLCIYQGSSITNPNIQNGVDSVDLTGVCQESNFTVEGQVDYSTGGIFSNFPLLSTKGAVKIRNTIQIPSANLPMTLEINQAGKTIEQK